MKTFSVLCLAVSLAPFVFGCSFTDRITKDDDAHHGRESADRIDVDDADDEADDEADEANEADEQDTRAGAAIDSNDGTKSPFLKGSDSVNAAKIDTGSENPAPVAVERALPAPVTPKSKVAVSEPASGCH